MNNLSFDIKTSKDFLKKLLEDYNDFVQNPTSSRIALNCAMTAWHLTEWVFNEYNNQFSLKFNNVVLFQKDIKLQCSSLQIMHDLANGTKHYLLDKHKPSIKETEFHKGPFSRVFSRQFDISILKIEMEDGTIIFFEDEIKTIIDFWKQYFKTNFSIEV